MNINRQPSGQPTGGQFAESARASASVGLTRVPEDQLYDLTDLKFIPGGNNIYGIEVLPRVDGQPGSTIDATLRLRVAENLDDAVPHLSYAGEGATREEHVEIYLASRRHVIAAHLEDRYGVYDAHAGENGVTEMYLGLNTSHIVSTPEQAHQAVMDDNQARSLADGDPGIWDRLGRELVAHESQVESIYGDLQMLDYFPAGDDDEVGGPLRDEISRFLTSNREEIADARELGLTQDDLVHGLGLAGVGARDFGPSDRGGHLADSATTDFEFEALRRKYSIDAA